jgi:hypothetical protein
MVVRACKALDNLDQIGALGFAQRVLLRPRQEMQRGIVGGQKESPARVTAGRAKFNELTPRQKELLGIRR